MDALGSVHDAQAGGDYTRDARRFDAFGGPVAGNGPDAFPLGFAASSSYQTDADTGLMLLGNRYYDPSIGRFLSQDPAKAGGNWYAYCGNNPLSYLDPTGLLPNMIDGVAIGSPGWRSATAPGTYGDQAAKYRIEGVYRVHYDANGNRMPGEVPQFLYNIAIPLTVNLVGNLQAARLFVNPFGTKGVTGLLTAGLLLHQQAGIPSYILTHVANGTDGDYKDKNSAVSHGTPLWQLLDNGGNFNGGMVEAGLGLTAWLTARTGDIHKSMMDGRLELDDPQGARVLQDGWLYARQIMGATPVPGP